MKKVELLAPCGSMESLYAAVCNGADAVYVGGSRFSARAYASNFDDENLIKAVNYCHLYGVKIYITVNTLIKDKEIKDIIEYVKFLYEIGVDALIIQDTGLTYLIRKNFPDLELHASTQMTIHNAEGAKYYKNLGFKRIVLSRELSINEIKNISDDLNIETEIFVHGALCVCYSGQCLMSSLIGGRSGNRGRCAQPCRLPYTIVKEKYDALTANNLKKQKNELLTKEELSGYLLSPKDICTLENIQDIIKSGTTSLKIEGRMKRPEYVAGVVNIYRRAINSYYSSSNEQFDFKGEVKKLAQLFNREGFSKGYLYGNNGRDMMAYSFPKNTGLFLGKANADLSVRLEDNIAIKDGIRVDEDGFTVLKIIKNSKEVEKAVRGDIVKLIPSNYKQNDTLFKTSDAQLLNDLQESFSENYSKKNKLQLVCKFKIDEPFEISCKYANKSFIASGEKVQKAIKKTVDKERIEENLKKTGNTAFEFSSIEFSYFEEGFLPMSVINSVRRDLLEQVESYIYAQNKRSFSGKFDFNREEKKQNNMESLFVSVQKNSQLRQCIKEDVKNVIVDIFSRESDIEIDSVSEIDIYIKVPNIIKEEFSEIVKSIDKYSSKIKGIVTSNAAIIERYSESMSIIGDYKLNIFNKYALDYYSSFLTGTCISVELNRSEIGELTKNPPMPCMMLIYGRIELMVSEYCPIGSTFGGKCSNSSCRGDCTIASYKLKDRKDEQFAIKTDKFCRSHIYNSVPLNLIPNKNELKGLIHRIDFVDESQEEIKRVLKNYQNASWEGEMTGYTRGHYRRGVE